MKRKILFALVLAVLLALCACSKAEPADSNSYYIYESQTSLDLSLKKLTDYAWGSAGAALLGQDETGPVWICGLHDDQALINQRCTLDLEGTAEQISIDPAGTVYALVKNEGYALWNLTANQLVCTLQELKKPVDLLCTADEFYIATKDVLFHYAWDGTCTFTADLGEEKFGSILTDASGAIYVLPAEASGAEGKILHCLDQENRTLERVETAMEDGVAANTYRPLFGSESWLYFTPNMANGWLDLEYGGLIWQLDLATGDHRPLCDTVSLGNQGEVLAVWTHGERILFLVEQEDEDGKTDYQLQELSPTQEQKQMLTMARIDNNSYVSRAIAKFNAVSRETYVSSVFYSGEDPDLALSLDIVSGDTPDMVSLYGFSLDTFAKQGVLKDLYPYLDADPELKAALIPNALTALETDGKLYQLTPTYILDTLVSGPEIGGILQPCTIDTVMAAAEAYPDALVATPSGDSMWTLDDLSYPAQILYLLLRYSTDRYIDPETGACSFDGEGFQNLLVFCKEAAERYRSFEYSGGDILLTNAKLFEPGGCKDAAEYLLLEPYTIVGYPTEHGSGNGLKSVIRFGICSTTKKPEAAWSFIASTLTAEYQEDVPWLPVREDALRNLLALGMEGKTGREPAKAGSFNADLEAALAAHPLTQDQADAMYALVTSVDRLVGDNDNVNLMRIILEEAEDYFVGGRSLAGVAANVQSRVLLLMAERG